MAQQQQAELPDFSFQLAGREKPTRLNPKKAEVAKRSARADRGKKAEEAVHKVLKAWMAASPHREFNRLTDARAAGRVIKAAPADFDFYQGPTRERASSHHGLIEVKEVAHDYRLAVDKVPQLARLVHRAHCGGLTMVLIHHSTTKQWRAISAIALHHIKEGASWDLRGFEVYPSAQAAMQGALPGVFDQ